MSYSGMGLLRWVETWSGIALRKLLAFSALLGVFVAALAIVTVDLPFLFWSVFFIVPYLVLRYRDPASTTLPYQDRLSG